MFASPLKTKCLSQSFTPECGKLYLLHSQLIEKILKNSGNDLKNHLLNHDFSYPFVSEMPLTLSLDQASDTEGSVSAR